MKKIFLILSLIIFLILGCIYGILFTKTGNGIISSYIENKVNAGQKDVKLKVNNFRLTFSTLIFDAKINDDSYINISGNLALLKKTVDLEYDININDLSTLNNLTKQDLKGPFSTKGIFRGNKKESTIEGFSNIAQSETKYFLTLIDYDIKKIKLDLKDAQINHLLFLLNKPIYTKGLLSINADIKNIEKNNLDGLISANIEKGRLDNEVINKGFKQNIKSSITFRSDINAVLLGNQIKIKTDFLSSLADIFMDKTTINLDDNKIWSDYKIDIKNMNKLESVIGKKLNGEFSTIGDFIVENKDIHIKGKSNIFESTTSFDFKLEKLAPKYLTFKIEKAKVENLLQMLNEPIYATGNLNIEGDIKNLDLANLDGFILTKINEGKMINEVLNALYDKNIKDEITFDLNVDTLLVSNKAVSKTNLFTNLANLVINKASYDFNENSLNSDYLLKIPSLEKLKDFTTTKLRGEVDIVGELQNKDGALLLTGSSNILDGFLDFTLKNDDLKANLKDIDIKALTYMFNYPDMFTSNGNVTLDYNLILKKGNLKAHLVNGQFLPNEFSILINQLSKFDLTKEIYKSVNINSNINDKLLITTIDMMSKNTQIDIVDSTLDFEKNLIDAKIDTKIKTSAFAINVKGDISKPKISLDTKDLLKEKLNKQIDKNKDKIEEKLNKVLGGKIEDEKAKELIKNLKSIF